MAKQSRVQKKVQARHRARKPRPARPLDVAQPNNHEARSEARRLAYLERQAREQAEAAAARDAQAAAEAKAEAKRARDREYQARRRAKAKALADKAAREQAEADAERLADHE